MDTFDQVPFSDIEFADNPQPRCPCVLVLDTSGSMSGAPIAELNRGLDTLRASLELSDLASQRVELALITFGPVQLVSDFSTVVGFRPGILRAGGQTPMGAAIEKAITLLKDRKRRYNENGIPYYRPWIFLITDGGPTDGWKTAASLVKSGEANKEFLFYAVGVENAKFEILRQISVRDPLKLKGLNFDQLFVWLSNSFTRVSESRVGDKIALENPTGPNGWAEID